MIMRTHISAHRLVHNYTYMYRPIHTAYICIYIPVHWYTQIHILACISMHTCIIKIHTHERMRKHMHESSRTILLRKAEKSDACSRLPNKLGHAVRQHHEYLLEDG